MIFNVDARSVWWMFVLGPIKNLMHVCKKNFFSHFFRMTQYGSDRPLNGKRPLGRRNKFVLPIDNWQVIELLSTEQVFCKHKWQSGLCFKTASQWQCDGTEKWWSFHFHLGSSFQVRSRQKEWASKKKALALQRSCFQLIVFFFFYWR